MQYKQKGINGRDKLYKKSLNNLYIANGSVQLLTTAIKIPNPKEMQYKVQNAFFDFENILLKDYMLHII